MSAGRIAPVYPARTRTVNLSSAPAPDVQEARVRAAQAVVVAVKVHLRYASDSDALQELSGALGLPDLTRLLTRKQIARLDAEAVAS